LETPARPEDDEEPLDPNERLEIDPIPCRAGAAPPEGAVRDDPGQEPDRAAGAEEPVELVPVERVADDALSERPVLPVLDFFSRRSEPVWTVASFFSSLAFRVSRAFFAASPSPWAERATGLAAAARTRTDVHRARIVDSFGLTGLRPRQPQACGESPSRLAPQRRGSGRAADRDCASCG